MNLQSLFTSPLASFEPFRDSPPDKSSLRYLLKTFRRLLVVSSATAIAAELLLIFSTFCSMQIVKEGSTSASVVEATLLYLLTVWGIAYLATRNFCIMDAIDSLVRERVASLLSAKLYRIGSTSSLNISRLKNVMDGDIFALSRFFFSLFSGFVPTLSALLFLIPAIVWVGGLAAIPALVIAPFPIVLSIWAARYQHSLESAMKEVRDHFVASLDEWIQNVRLVRLLGWNDALQSRVLEVATRTVELEVKRDKVISPVFSVSLTWPLMGIAVYLVSAYFLGTTIDVAESFGSMWLIGHLFGRLQQLPFLIGCYPKAKVALQRIDEFMALPEEEKGSHEGELVAFELKNIKVEGDTGTILDIPDLKIRLHLLTVITGSVASGKSTLLRLLSGNLLPTEGEVFGVTKTGMRIQLASPEGRSLIRSSIAYQPQESFVAQAKLSFNVSLEHSSLAAIDRAMELTEFLPDLETFGNEDVLLGEHGVNLSGGQKQRVVLARAIHSNRPILILDDPFSALDASTQVSIARSLMLRDGGLIIATHHPHLLNGDITIHLDQGQVVVEAECQ